MVEVLQIETPSLGDRSYLIHDGAVALVIDPQRDIDRVTALAAEHDVRITHVAETHIHNDYLTGGLALARATSATYLVNEADPVRFAREPVRDGARTPVGDAIRARGPWGAGAGVAGQGGRASRAGRAGRVRSPPRRADAREIRRRIEAGEWVIDLRDRLAFAAGFLPGSVCFTLGNSFASYVGWTVPWGAPGSLLGETPAPVAAAPRELARSGVGPPVARATGEAPDCAGDQP